jgi:hypothetical protein
MNRAREVLRLIDEIQDDLEAYQQEAVNLCFTSIAIVTVITVLAYHLGDASALILLYLGWCLYVACWALLYHHRRRP